MGINAVPIHDDFDLRYLNGPWRNDACCGYVVLAMEKQGFVLPDIQRALMALYECFDDTSVKEAADYYSKW